MNTPEYIYGRKVVKELLQEKPEQVTKIFLKQQVEGKIIREIEQLAARSTIPVQRVPGIRLKELVGAVNDQGVAAGMSAASYLELEDWLESLDLSANPVLIALDTVEDPHNAGALIRSAAAAGMSAVLVPKHRQAPLGAAAWKASAGTLQKIPVLREVNLNQALLRLKKAGFWICGTDMQGGELLWNQRFDLPLVVVIGGEEKGIRKKTRDHCDFMVRIPMTNHVESLNASVSGSLICYEIFRQRSTRRA